MKNRSLLARIGFAVAGWRAAWARERSFRTQVWFAGLALLALLMIRPSPIWWALVALTCALVLALELINSALEGLIDLLHPAIHPEIKVIKDMLAGAVLAISCAALAVALALVVAYVRAVLLKFET
ncbi:MAG: diacylglycerol kinase [Sphingomonas sp.]